MPADGPPTGAATATKTRTTAAAAARAFRMGRHATVDPEGESCPIDGIAFRTASTTGSAERGLSEFASQSRTTRSIRGVSLMPSLGRNRRVVGLDRRSERDQCVVQSGAGGSDRDVEYRGDLLERQADMEMHERRPSDGRRRRL